jgi:hypothetical protein
LTARAATGWLAAGVLTNREFERKAEFTSLDDAIRAVFFGGPWRLYDDFPTSHALANLLTLGLLARRARRNFEQCGDITAWPFRRRADYDAALHHAPYLNRPSNGGMQPAGSDHR